MSLLASDEDEMYSSDNEKGFASHALIAGSLVGDSKEQSSGRGGGKSKKGDKWGRSGEEKRSQRWSKHREKVVQEKTPKKSRGQNKPISWSPPDSPKGAPRPVEGKGAGQGPRTPTASVGAVTGTLLPSPNIKNQRKRYSQLATGSTSSSADEEESPDFLLYNHPVLQDQIPPLESNSSVVHSTNPFLAEKDNVFKDPTSVMDSHTHITTDHTPMEPTGAAREPEQQQAWVPMVSALPPTASTTQQGTGNSLLLTTNFDHINDHSTNRLGFGLGAGAFLDASQQPLSQSSDAGGGGGIGNIPNLPSSTLPFSQEVKQLVATAEKNTAKNVEEPRHEITHTATATPTSTATPSAAEDWTLSEELRTKCSKQFAELHPVNGILEGSKARQFFTRSKLPFQELSAIWRLSDRDQDNGLSREEFCIAMKLVLMRRRGLEIPSKLPEVMCPRQQGQGAGNGGTSSGAWSAQGVTPTPPSLPSSLHANKSPRTSLLEMDGARDEGLARGTSPTFVDNVDNYSMCTVQDKLLLFQDEERDRDSSRDRGGMDQAASPQPPVGRIISLEEEEEEEEGREDAVLVKSSALMDMLDSVQNKAQQLTKSALPKSRQPKFRRPPPPAMAKKKTAPSSGITTISSSGELSPLSPAHSSYPEASPHISSSSSSTDAMLILDNITSTTGTKTHPPPKPSRISVPPPKKSSNYMALIGSPESDHGQEALEEVGAVSTNMAERPATDTGGGFQWQQLSDGGVASSSADESNEKGHSRSTSLDLNKMLLAGQTEDVIIGLPSAVPPKPPPKFKSATLPLEPLLQLEECVERETWAATSASSKYPRSRSLSTGSMTSTGVGTNGSGIEDHHGLDLATAALLLEHTTTPQKPPKPKKVPIMPPKPTADLLSSSTDDISVITNAQVGETVTNSNHVTKAGKSSDPGVVGGLSFSPPGGSKHLPLVGKYNKLEEPNQRSQQQVEVGEQVMSYQYKLATEPSMSGGGGGRDEQESIRSRQASSSSVKDKLELKSSIRSLKENNEALQDINKELEQKLFKLMEERVRLARDLDLFTCMS